MFKMYEVLCAVCWNVSPCSVSYLNSIVHYIYLLCFGFDFQWHKILHNWFECIFDY